VPSPKKTDRDRHRVWIGSIVMACQQFDRMIAFWSAALGYRPRRPPSDDWVVLEDPLGHGPNVSLQKVPDGPGEDYRFHFDLYSEDPLGEVQRLVALGATVREAPQAGRDFVTLADPDGNPFDVIDVNWPDDGRVWAFGRRP
jgi:catechol 2,3-dioxygenase-like lactoylglutathione lyase family enzyme